MTPRGKRIVQLLLWLVLAAPAIYQLILLATAIAGRIGYPYDLEWMEGGLLHHALRMREGHSIYTAPSIEFIPYLYTPMYPALLATLGGMFGLTYTLGRAISMLSLVGIAIVAARSIGSSRFRHIAIGPAWAGVAIGLGLFAAAYPYMEGWYDLVRADTLFLFLVTAGLAAAARWGGDGTGASGHARVAAIAAILAYAFFCKQTGIFYVALGGAIIMVLAWRRAITYVAVAGTLGLGGVAVFNATTDGWFWTYVRKIHSAHDFNMDRFWKSFGNILWHFPAMTIVIAIGIVVVGYTWLRKPRDGSRRELPKQTWPFVLWTSAFAVSTLVGAIGWGTEFAHFNAYMPAFLHGGLAAGAAVPAIGACVGILWGSRPRAEVVVVLAPAAIAVALGASLVKARWEPQRFIPTPADRAAGDKLIAHIASLPGDVWMPSHPWYALLAGKRPHVHRMGIKDVTTRQSRTISGLEEALQTHRFAALVLDNRDVFLDLPALTSAYRPEQKLPADERPHVYTGAQIVPDSIWVPAVPATPPSGAKVVFDFESQTYAGWTRSGPAWGEGPIGEPLPGQDLVLGASGQRFATSMHGGDATMGRLTSPSFELDGTKLTMKLGGASDSTKLRVELWVDGAIVRDAAVPPPGGDGLRDVAWDLTDLRGKQATLVLVDDSDRGHLDIDDVWLWQ